MTEVQQTLKQHIFGWIGDRQSSRRDIPFFYKDIVGTNPAHRVDIITASPDHHDWYFRIYYGVRLVCKDRHFHSEEDALNAARMIRNEAEATQLRLRKIEQWAGDHSSTVDGNSDSDVIISEVKPNEWWIFVTEENSHRKCSGPRTSLEEAFLVYRFEFHKAN